MISTDNLIAKMFDLPKIKQMIADCPFDEVVILCPQWPINKPSYFDPLDNESEQYDLDEIEEEIGATLIVTDYNDLVADPHGLYCND